MTQEEKAKAYDEALKLAKDYHEDKNCFEYLKGVLENIFPELAESEDERMRNVAIDACKYMVDNFENSTKQYEDAIAWLEKQGEKDKLIQELGEYKVKYTQEVLGKHINSICYTDKNEKVSIF